MATKANLASASKSGVTAQQLRDEINKCHSMVKQVEQLLRRHSGSMRRH